jgi:1-acyl-sn-glycerol-3-phosphate acyltransferase
VGIGGSERAQPKGSRFIKPVKVHVVVGEPLVPRPAEGGRATSRRAVKELSGLLQAELQALFDEAEARRR